VILDITFFLIFNFKSLTIFDMVSRKLSTTQLDLHFYFFYFYRKRSHVTATAVITAAILAQQRERSVQINQTLGWLFTVIRVYAWNAG